MYDTAHSAHNMWDKMQHMIALQVRQNAAQESFTSATECSICISLTSATEAERASA
jgi:hypothetical protein